MTQTQPLPNPPVVFSQIGCPMPCRQIVFPGAFHFNIVKMSLIQSQVPKLFARDIARYSDAELDQYLEANGRSGFPPNFMVSKVAKFTQRLVDVQDPENLPEDFIQTLR
jgi:hypothetical protein